MTDRCLNDKCVLDDRHDGLCRFESQDRCIASSRGNRCVYQVGHRGNCAFLVPWMREDANGRPVPRTSMFIDREFSDEERAAVARDLPTNVESAGGTRFSAGKPRGAWFTPILGLAAVQRVAMHGARKYAPLDWREGQSFSTLMDCTWSHVRKMLHYGPMARDEESGELHAAHAAWNLLALLTAIEAGETERLDDTAQWRGITAAEARQRGMSWEEAAAIGTPRNDQRDPGDEDRQ